MSPRLTLLPPTRAQGAPTVTRVLKSTLSPEKENPLLLPVKPYLLGRGLIDLKDEISSCFNQTIKMDSPELWNGFADPQFPLFAKAGSKY